MSTTDAAARQAIQAILNGNVDESIIAVDYGPFQDYIKTLYDSYQTGGSTSVQWDWALMQHELPIATLMADGQPTTPLQDSTIPVGPTLKTMPTKIFLSQSADDEGNAQCVNKLFENQFLYCAAYGFLRYTGRYWRIADAETALERAIVYTLKQRQLVAVQAQQDKLARACVPTTRHVKDCLFLLRSLITLHVDDFDRDPELLNVNNGVLNLRTGKLAQHEPQQRFTYCVPVDYDEQADTAMWETFLADVVGGGPDVIRYMQEAIGYSLTGYTTEECLFYVHGPTRSGKGTFSETLLSILPNPLGVEVDFSTFTAQRDSDAQNFDLAPLKPSRLIFASESNRYNSLNTGKVKALTGGNDVRCAFKHRDHFSYRPQYKIWLVSNWPVNADVDDDAAWYRVKVIEFPNSQADKEDKNLKFRMKSKENLTAVLAWAVQGSLRWFGSANGLTTPTHVAQATKRHRADLDMVQMWLDECTKVAAANWESSEEVYKSYSEWCKLNGIKAKEQRGLSNALKLKGYQPNVVRWVGTRHQRGFVGLEIL